MPSVASNPTTTTESANPAPDLITPRELAAALKMSLRTLARHHEARTGPPRISLGRHLFYRRAAVEAWLQSCESYGKGMPSPRKLSKPASRTRNTRRAA